MRSMGNILFYQNIFNSLIILKMVNIWLKLLQLSFIMHNLFGSLRLVVARNVLYVGEGRGFGVVTMRWHALLLQKPHNISKILLLLQCSLRFINI